MTHHPQHELVAAEVRSWYTDWPGRSPGPSGSSPDIGVRTHEAAYGYLRDGPGPAGRRLVLTVDDEVAARDALRSAAEYYGSEQFDVWVDDRDRAMRLEPVLVEAGFHAPDATVVLALVGPLRHVDGPADLQIQEVADEGDLRTWARVKLVGFADGEEPTPERLEEEVTSRRSERPISRLELGLVGGAEPAAVLAHYTASPDQMVFLLTTLVPFRHRGIAQAMLAHWAQRAATDGARSLLINCDEHGRPAQLYRRMGFTDPVYWHRRYQRQTGPG